MLHDFTSRMFEAINVMMLDMLAAVARKNYKDRRRRQAQGIVKAQSGRQIPRTTRGRVPRRRSPGDAQERAILGQTL